MILIDFICTI